LLQNNAMNLNALHRLRALGLSIALDDFGTGYSSLSYLRSFPFDKIKIDQTFVRDVGDCDDSMAIIQSIADLGRSLKMVTTAEGVETSEQLNIVRNAGCTEAQGYYFSRPVENHSFDALVRGQSSKIGSAA
jgi:EAL domain-containing protein (putative c-di-GMP-specific phosphodiesterase class I)